MYPNGKKIHTAVQSLGSARFVMFLIPAKKNNRTLPKTQIENVMVLMGIVLVLMETIMVVYWYVMDSIGGMLNHIGKCPKHI